MCSSICCQVNIAVTAVRLQPREKKAVASCTFKHNDWEKVNKFQVSCAAIWLLEFVVLWMCDEGTKQLIGIYRITESPSMTTAVIQCDL